MTEGDETLLATDYLKETARRLPDKVAVTDERREMTYGELWRDACRVGASLLELSEGREPVALWLGREGWSIAAAQGVALSGRPYVTLDVSMPSKRMARLFEILHPLAVITDRKHSAAAVEFLAGMSGQNIWLLIYEELTAEMPGTRKLSRLEEAGARRSQDDPLTIIFTSGSTGVPKGVVVSHRMLCADTDWHVQAMSMDESMVRAGQAPLYFGMGAYFDVYETLATGGTLHLLPEGSALFAQAFMERLTELAVNTVFWVPSLFRTLVEQGGLEAKRLPPLRAMHFSGEAMPMGVISAWRKAFPDTEFYHYYAATELAIVSWCKVDDGMEALQALPIGHPCKYRLRLLDDTGREVPEGGIGEIVVSGPVALGYMGDPERTAEVFGEDDAGERFFCTGDLAKWGEDGLLHYVSRRDSQIKHLGYRIELGEIEAAAAELPGLMAACLYRAESDELVLFYAGDMSPKEIMQALSSLLPRYMWPARLEKLAALPCTPSGKIDRQALKKRLAELK